MLKCPRCKKQDLSPDDIRWNGIYIKCCKECDRSYQKEYRGTINGRLRTRISNVKQKFGISLEEFNNLVEFQQGGCAICRKKPNNNRNLVIDHNHETNEVRGLLCYACNSALGHLQEDEDLFINCIEYLKRTTWNKKRVA